MANPNFSSDVDRYRALVGGLHRIPLPRPARARPGHADGLPVGQGREEEEEEEGKVLVHAGHLQPRRRQGGGLQNHFC